MEVDGRRSRAVKVFKGQHQSISSIELGSKLAAIADHTLV